MKLGVSRTSWSICRAKRKPMSADVAVSASLQRSVRGDRESLRDRDCGARDA